MHFELRDTSIGVIKYEFELNMDSFGQILRFDWPRKNYNKRGDFLNTDLSLKFAIDYANKKGYKTEDPRINLKLLKGSQNLCWLISFLQVSSEEMKKFKTLAVDVKRLFVVEETEMFEYPPVIN